MARSYEYLEPEEKKYLAEQYAKALSHALDPKVLGMTDEDFDQPRKLLEAHPALQVAYPFLGSARVMGTGTEVGDIKRILKQIQASGGDELINEISTIGESKGYFKVKGKNVGLRDAFIDDFKGDEETFVLNAAGFADDQLVGKSAQERYATQQGLDLSKSSYQAFGPVADWNVRGKHAELQKPWQGQGLHKSVGDMSSYVTPKKAEELLPQQLEWFKQSPEFKNIAEPLGPPPAPPTGTTVAQTPAGPVSQAPVVTSPVATPPPGTTTKQTPTGPVSQAPVKLPATPAPTTPAPTTTATAPKAPPIKAPTGLTPKQEERYGETVTTGGPSKDPQQEAARIAAIKQGIPAVSASTETTTVPTTSTPPPEKSQQEQIRERLATRGPDPAQQLLNVISSARATREGLQDKQRAEGRAWIDRLVKNPENWKMGARDPRDERTTREERYGKPVAKPKPKRKRKKAPRLTTPPRYGAGGTANPREESRY